MTAIPPTPKILPGLMVSLWVTLFCPPALALEISYGGRLADQTGAPIPGPLNITFRFFAEASGGSALYSTQVPNVDLVDGMFQVAIPLTAQQLDLILGDGSQRVYIQVETLGKVYPRQRFNHVPLALRIPIDPNKFEYDSDGRLTLTSSFQIPAAPVTTVAGRTGAVTLSTSDISGLSSLATTSAVSGGAAGTISDGSITNDDISTTAAIAQSKVADLTSDLAAKEPSIIVGAPGQYFSGNKSWQTLNTSAVAEGINLYFTDTRARQASSATAPLAYNTASGVMSIGQASTVANGYLSSSDFTSFNNKQSAITSATIVNAGTVTSALQNGHELKPFDVASGNTGELRFDELAANGANYVGFKAPDALPGDIIWTLPSVVGTSGQVLSTGGPGGVLSWITPASAPVSSVAGRTGAVTLSNGDISGLGSLATASVVAGGLGGTITDGTITNDDISASAAIAQSKIANLTTDLAAKEATLTAGTSAQYYRGDKTWQNLSTTAVTEGTNFYFTPSRARQAFSATAPIAYDTATGVMSMGQANTVANGYLSSADFTSFNNKQSAITSASIINAGTVTSALQNGHELKPFDAAAGNTGELRFDELAANGANYVGLKAPDALAGNVIWTLPSVIGTGGQVLSTSGASGILSWITLPTSPVTTVAGRTGAVTLSNTDISGLGSLATVNAVSGGVSGTITDGTITNDDISGSAAITDTKLASIATAGKVANSATTATNANTGSTIVARDASGNFSAGTITATLSGTATNVTGTVAIANGGTGATTTSGAFDALSPLTNLGDVLYAGASGTDTRLAGNASATKMFLSSTGTGSAAQAPAWGVLAAADIPALDAGKITTGTLSNSLVNWSAPGPIGSSTPNTGSFTNVTTTGSVGIGTTAPSSTLDVRGTGTFAGVLNVNKESADLFSNPVGFNKRGTTGDANAAVTAGSELGYLTFNGWDGSAYGRGAHILAVTSENFSTTAHGSHLRFATVPNGTTPPAERMRITDAGNVGIGTTAPATALDVTGQIRSKVYNASSGTSFNWNNGNIQYTTATCGNFPFTNLADGGVYTLIVKSTTSGTCVFSQSGLTFRSQSALTTASGSYTIFNFIVAGSDVFVKINRGF